MINARRLFLDVNTGDDFVEFRGIPGIISTPEYFVFYLAPPDLSVFVVDLKWFAEVWNERHIF